MIEHPILYTGQNVRRILAGEKTQTRRVVTNRTALEWLAPGMFLPSVIADPGNRFSPYGYPGDTLWVRETWRTHERPSDCVDGIVFRADDAFVPIENSIAAADRWVYAHDNGRHGSKWRPSIFMPRWASRITLPVLSVRVERLQSISVDDAIAEGIRGHRETTYDGPGGFYVIDDFRELWDSINGKRPGCSWATNPWVRVVSWPPQVRG